MKLGIGAGHGLYTLGKRCLKSLDPKETREWVLNNRIVVKVIEKLKAYENVEILRTDDPTGKRDVPLAERTRSANNWRAEVYLSIHHNAGIGGGTGGGIVIYRHPQSSAASETYQNKLYTKLITHTGLKGNRSNPLAEANLHMVRETRMPSLLLELGFMDSKTDVPVILTDKYAEQCADAIVEFLAEEFKLKKIVVAPPPVKDFILPEGKFFRVVVGSFQSRNNAEQVQKELAEDGFDSFLAIYEK